MPDKVQFFGWAAPANDVTILPDHTWVTTYDSRKTAYPDIKAWSEPGMTSGIVGEFFDPGVEPRATRQAF
jgi:hypothetical protein